MQIEKYVNCAVHSSTNVNKSQWGLLFNHGQWKFTTKRLKFEKKRNPDMTK
jgi:hypothetical protein